MDKQPVIGRMLGDMTAIGPEISAKILASGNLRRETRIVVIGDARVLKLGSALSNRRWIRCARAASTAAARYLRM